MRRRRRRRRRRRKKRVEDESMVSMVTWYLYRCAVDIFSRKYNLIIFSSALNPFKLFNTFHDGAADVLGGLGADDSARGDDFCRVDLGASRVRAPRVAERHCVGQNVALKTGKDGNEAGGHFSS